MIEEAKKYQSFYTKSTPIVEYMIEKLKLEIDDLIFEPCAGDGVFLESILSKNINANIDAYELNDTAYQILRNKFSFHPNVNIKHGDTLLDDELNFRSGFGGIYNKIIANPPYGAWQDKEKRALLKKIYTGIYIKETYTLFLYRCIELLKDKGILCFIIPDTYLNLHMHKALRRHFLKNTKILELLLFPSSFFPGVNFGYANLSIITLQKSESCEACLDNSFKVITSFKNIEQLSNINETNLRVLTFSQKDILRNSDYAFFISENLSIASSINNSKLNIGDIADCVTGFYSGNDKKFLKINDPILKNGKKYELIDDDKICKNFLEAPNILDGIEGKQCYIPLVKGGSKRYLKRDGWFMDWSYKAVSHYKKDKKARFQNSQYYFKLGIGVPMVSSSSITAALIDKKLFDQSIVGIFPKDNSILYYLLAFFNSQVCNDIIRTINPSANNSANYIKKIPYLKPTENQLRLINQMIDEIILNIKNVGTYDEKIESEINNIISDIYAV
ncbi:MAG: class I SAM-dependent DNA methyltransferase [Ignavibacteria bacterium]